MSDDENNNSYQERQLYNLREQRQAAFQAKRDTGSSKRSRHSPNTSDSRSPNRGSLNRGINADLNQVGRFSQVPQSNMPSEFNVNQQPGRKSMGPVDTTFNFQESRVSPKSKGSYGGQNYNKQQIYSVTFKIKYQTIPGEDLYVLGDIPELGSNKDISHGLVWTAGHIWVSKEPVVTNTPYFSYKYMLTGNEKQVIDQEKGIARVADISLLKNMTAKTSNIGNGIKNVEINDVWEKFKVHFTVYHPIIYRDQKLILTGNRPEFGRALQMERQLNLRSSWLSKKYGQEIVPYQATVEFANETKDGSGKPLRIEYNYSVQAGEGPRVPDENERDPTRILDINHPLSYKGQLEADSVVGKKGLHIQHLRSDNWVINGCVQKCDANFLKDFYLDQIHDQGIFIGSYPIDEQDVKEMKDIGITAVLNLQTQDDITERGYSWAKLTQLYQARGIKTAIHYPIDDYDEIDHPQKTFAAAQYLNDLVNSKGHKVFVHCNSGISRASTVVLCYLALYKKVPVWRSIDQCDEYLLKYHQVSTPNQYIIEQIIKDNQEFQHKQHDAWTTSVKAKKKSPAKPNNRLLKLQAEEVQLIDSDKRRRNEIDHTRKRWEQDTQRLEEEQAQKLALLQNQYDKDYHEYQRKSAQLDIQERELSDRSRNAKINYDNERQREIQEKQVELSESEIQKQHALEERNKCQAELDRMKQLLQQNNFQNIAERKEAERYQAETEQRFKMWQQEFDKQEKKLQTDFDIEIQATRRKIIEGEQLIDQENERQRLLRLQKGGFTDDEIEAQCDELFKFAPVKFKPRKGNNVDFQIDQVIKAYNVRVPIIQDPNNDNLYLIGANKLPCTLKQDNVVVRVGGGTDKLDDYVMHNHRTFEKILVIHMINSNQSLEWVTDQLMAGKKIKGVMTSGVQARDSSTSPSRQTSSQSPSRQQMSPSRGYPQGYQTMDQQSAFNNSQQMQSPRSKQISGPSGQNISPYAQNPNKGGRFIN